MWVVIIHQHSNFGTANQELAARDVTAEGGASLRRRKIFKRFKNMRPDKLALASIHVCPSLWQCSQPQLLYRPLSYSLAWLLSAFVIFQVERRKLKVTVMTMRRPLRVKSGWDGTTHQPGFFHIYSFNKSFFVSVLSCFYYQKNLYLRNISIKLLRTYKWLVGWEKN